MRPTDRPLRIFADRAYLPEGFAHCTMLRPHWGDPTDHPAYIDYIRAAPGFQELAGIDEADVALLPFDGQYLMSKDPAVASKASEAAGRLAELARAKGLRVLALNHDEAIGPIGVDGAVVLRVALDRRLSSPTDFAMPGWFDDYVNEKMGGSIAVRDKPAVPAVGFCGMAASGRPRLRKAVKSLAVGALGAVGVYVPHNEGLQLRRRAMEAIAADPGLRANFIVRDGFFGGATRDPTLEAKVRREYFDNFLGSDYALAVRGFGNFSFRFFEAMSVGRIPVLIDTECILPYDFLHDYRDLCVIVPEGEVGRVGEHIRRFHDGLSDGDFRDLQARIRKFWEDWLSPVGFFRNVPLHLGPEARRPERTGRRP